MFQNYYFGHNIFWAGFIGFLLGILFSFTVWAGNRVLQTKASFVETEEAALLQPGFSITLNQPVDGAATNSSSVKVSGTTQGNATVLISGGVADTIIESDGTFTTDYALVEGPNEITVTAISEDGRQAVTSRTVFYTTESLQ